MSEFPFCLPAADLMLERVHSQAGALVVELRATGSEALCPTCGRAAHRGQSRYRRTLADLPCQGVPVRLHVLVRRFRCEQTDCSRAIFSERLPTLAPPRARTTTRVHELLTRMGVALGGEAAGRLLPGLGLVGSADTILRRVRQAAPVPAPPPRVVGVDDWVIRRGHRYGTILVDLERRAPVDLLPDRTADTLAHWLREHPDVAVVTRDRAETYAQGIREGAPNAVQVGDRRHLLKNVGDLLERVLQRYRGALDKAAARACASTSASAAPPTPAAHSDTMAGVVHEATEQDGAVAAAAVPLRASTTPTKRQQIYAQVHALHAQGLSVYAMSQRTRLSRPTVRKYLRADICPERAKRRTKIGTRTDHDNYLRTRWNDGCRDAAVLFRELVEQDFRGTLRTVQRHVASWRRGDDPHEPAHRAPPCAVTSTGMRAPSPRELRWWLLSTAAAANSDPVKPELNPDQRRYIDHLLDDCPTIAAGQRLAQEFTRLVRARNAAALLPWLEQAKASSLAEFRDFASRLCRDERAVKAALAETWSNGQTEGQVTKLKMLKRQMYGRASVGLLRQRLLLAA
ncbi:ISL3 family transposase [Sorangium sp. So ce302]|uniref:ISL3 family transposase n=1 Tax=Sorangium sp. So ce302 TaxID=3133297 RepID=UPI003F61402D